VSALGQKATSVEFVLYHGTIFPSGSVTLVSSIVC